MKKWQNDVVKSSRTPCLDVGRKDKLRDIVNIYGPPETDKLLISTKWHLILHK